MEYILTYWIRRRGHNVADFPIPIVSEIIDQFAFRPEFTTEQEYKLKRGHKYISLHSRHYMKGYVKQCAFIFKLFVVGNPGVGKTEMIKRFEDHSFSSETYDKRSGIDFIVKTVPVNGLDIKVQIFWSTTLGVNGDERSSHYHGTDGFIIMYDVTDIASYSHVRDWKVEIEECAPKTNHVMLIGNKVDLRSERRVSILKGQGLASNLGIEDFTEISAKRGSEIDRAFHLFLSRILLNVQRAGSPWID